MRKDGIDAWRKLIKHRECGIAWRAQQIVGDVSPDAPVDRRRHALGRAGSWLGSLPPRLSLEQEDAVKIIAERCGYSTEAAQRAFRAKFFRDVMPISEESPAQQLIATSTASRRAASATPLQRDRLLVDQVSELSVGDGLG